MTTNYQAGHDAEQRAAEYLTERGFEVIELNWKTRYCEIDIVAKKNKVMYFIEVKSRKNSRFGSGIDYITPKKLQQMRFSSEMWVQHHRWDGDYRLAAVTVDGSELMLIDEL